MVFWNLFIGICRKAKAANKLSYAFHLQRSHQHKVHGYKYRLFISASFSAFLRWDYSPMLRYRLCIPPRTTKK